MKRRRFIKNSGLGIIGTAYAPLFLSSTGRLLENTSIKKLIVIQLSGGNDGLNTIIPYENDLYHQARPNIGIPTSEVIKASEMLGFNPAMSEFNNLYKDGYVSIINSVGYPNPNRSHFRSMDIWQSASDAHTYLKTGWIGRYMDAYCSNNHAALEIDSQLSLALHGKQHNGLALNNSGALYRSLKSAKLHKFSEDSQAINLDEQNLGYLYKTLGDTYQSAEYIKDAHKIKDNNYDFPKSQLGRKLATLSQFIRSGLDTQVYYISHNGFDSHANQRKQQERLLREYSEGVTALVQSLEKSGHMEDVLIMTFSEFGRRVEENASRGTDHGKANNLFLIGKNMQNPGFYNNAPDLENLDEGDVPYSIDFRNVYADILSEWLEKDPEKIISKSFTSLGII